MGGSIVSTRGKSLREDLGNQKGNFLGGSQDGQKSHGAYVAENGAFSQIASAFFNNENFWKKLVRDECRAYVESDEFADRASYWGYKGAKDFASEVMRWGLPMFALAWSAVIGMAIYNINSMNVQMGKMSDSLHEVKETVVSIQTQLAHPQVIEYTAKTRGSKN